MTTAIHEALMELPAANRDAIMRALISEDFSRRFEILLGLEPDGPAILDDLYDSEVLRLPGNSQKDDEIDTLSLGFLPDGMLEGRHHTPLTPREVGVINLVLTSALVVDKNLEISEQARHVLHELSRLREQSLVTA